MKKILLSIICLIVINFLSFAQQTQSPLVKSFEEYKKLKEKYDKLMNMTIEEIWRNECLELLKNIK